MNHDDEVVYRVLHAARLVHETLGTGFVESIYTRALTAELVERGFHVDREKTIKIWYGPRVVGKHRLDLLVDNSIIVELKASRAIIPVHVAQMNSYLACDEVPVRAGSKFRRYGNAMATHSLCTRRTDRTLRLLRFTTIYRQRWHDISVATQATTALL
jgi:GxxExxY protein